MNKLIPGLMLFIMSFSGLLPTSASAQTKIAFPTDQPKNGNFNRPAAGEIVDVTPPGFAWWRAGDRDQVDYRVRIKDAVGKEIHLSGLLKDPVYIPSSVLPAGFYVWTVEALSPDGTVQDVRPQSAFIILDDAAELPWIDPGVLLSRVSKKHPRLLFPAEKLASLRKSNDQTWQSSYQIVKAAADKGLALPLVTRPDFDKYTGRKEFAQKRTAYREDYHRVNDTYLEAVVPMAFVYLLGGETKYGQAVKAHILNMTDWGLDGVMSVQDPRFDEVGLRLARALPQAYDWCYDVFTEPEREKVEAMLVGFGNKLLERMQNRDFLNTSGESHDGRVPGYLLEFAIALAEHPAAVAWMDYGLKAVMTVFPHWAGSDGGWAEGINYAMTYNDLFITPLQSVTTATGFDLWQKPFFSKFPYFLLYCIQPNAETTPFGDQENLGIRGRKGDLYSMLLFNALRKNDPEMRWWAELYKPEEEGSTDGLSAIRNMIYPDVLAPQKPENVINDRVFNGVGWAVMHSDLANPVNDLMVMFKSSPFGPVSHSHVDQNSFAILKNGAALAIPAGERYPQHGSPFHTQYTRLTMAHNCILVNGQGQLDREEQANGLLTGFTSSSHMAYVGGEAHLAYGPPVTKYVRHVILIRPAIVLVVDDVEAEEDVQIDWLLHAKDKFEIDQDKQKVISRREGEMMEVLLFAEEKLQMTQTDAWPMDPKEGYPMVTSEPPQKQWHFSAHKNSKKKNVRIAALMSVGGEEQVQIEYYQNMDGLVKTGATFADQSRTEIQINLTAAPDMSQPLINVKYIPAIGESEFLVIPR